MSLTRPVGTAGLLTLLAASLHAQDSLEYLLSPASRLEVKAGKAGLLGFAGHDHLIRARVVSGRVIYRPHLPAGSRVEISVPVDSLEVLTPPDTAEIRKVTESMRTEVLRVDVYPTITFVSTAVAPITDGFRVQGRLTLAGVTRDVAADFRVEVGADTLRAIGSFSVKQTDFGIKPYRGGPAGTVRVADRVSFEVDALAIRTPPP
ncbi:MAG TPA: YceI family protein [Gemmatimonadales bacterium]|nr:YceI family protein [Gemmatimonadales bacterium]